MKIIQVDNRKDLNRFLDFPKKLYYDILKFENYVMPLKLISKITIGNYKSKNKHLLLAVENDEVLGTLGIKVHNHNGEDKLNFGFFECMPGREDVAKNLLDHAQSLYPHLEMIGPYSFRMEDPYMGVLVEGQDAESYFMMKYNPDYYKNYFENNGFERAMDVLAYDVLGSTKLPEEMKAKALACEQNGFELRVMNSKKMKSEVKVIARIFNDALSENWGFEELIQEQVNDMYLMFKFFINPNLVFFARKNGEDVGCLIMLPNFNPIVSEGRGSIGIKMIWNILTKKNKLDSARGYALGIKKDFHGQGLGSFLVWNAWDRCTNNAGIKKGEISWILSNNDGMNNLTHQMQGKPNKKFRVYSKKPIC